MADNASSAYLGSLSELSAHSFSATREATDAILRLLSEQLGLRSSFLTHITPEENRNHVLAAYNVPGGCDIPAGALLPLSQTYCSAISDAIDLAPVLIEDTRADPRFRRHPAAVASPKSAASSVCPSCSPMDRCTAPSAPLIPRPGP